MDRNDGEDSGDMDGEGSGGGQRRHGQRVQQRTAGMTPVTRIKTNQRWLGTDGFVWHGRGENPTVEDRKLAGARCRVDDLDFQTAGYHKRRTGDAGEAMSGSERTGRVDGAHTRARLHIQEEPAAEPPTAPAPLAPTEKAETSAPVPAPASATESKPQVQTTEKQTTETPRTASSPKVTAGSPKAVAGSPKVAAGSPKAAAPSPQAVTTSPKAVTPKTPSAASSAELRVKTPLNNESSHLSPPLERNSPTTTASISPSAKVKDSDTPNTNTAAAAAAAAKFSPSATEQEKPVVAEKKETPRKEVSAPRLERKSSSSSSVGKSEDSYRRETSDRHHERSRKRSLERSELPMSEEAKRRAERRRKRKSNWDVGDPRKGGSPITDPPVSAAAAAANQQSFANRTSRAGIVPPAFTTADPALVGGEASTIRTRCRRIVLGAPDARQRVTATVTAAAAAAAAAATTGDRRRGTFVNRPRVGSWTYLSMRREHIVVGDVEPDSLRVTVGIRYADGWKAVDTGVAVRLAARGSGRNSPSNNWSDHGSHPGRSSGLHYWADTGYSTIGLSRPAASGGAEGPGAWTEIYADAGELSIKVAPLPLKEMADKKLRRARYEAILTQFRNIYRKTFGRKAAQRVLRVGAHWMLPDDHEIINNFNFELVQKAFQGTRNSLSSEEERERFVALQLHCRAGLQAYYEFQYQLYRELPWERVDFLEDALDDIIRAYPVYFAVELQQLKLLFLDVRFERSFFDPSREENLPKLVSDDQRQFIDGNLRTWSQDDRSTAVVFASMPLFFQSAFSASIAHIVEHETYPGMAEQRPGLEDLFHIFQGYNQQQRVESNTEMPPLLTPIFEIAYSWARHIPLLSSLLPRSSPWYIEYDRVFLGRNYGVLEFTSDGNFTWDQTVTESYDEDYQRRVQSVIDASTPEVLGFAVLLITLFNTSIAYRVVSRCCTKRRPKRSVKTTKTQ
ncbi:hypothetical protein ON010_g9686 [Phytophthora cinnamomi]|nr:hypothetical protein ON010_g9686 [Phytophthora cinnamomi]